MKENELTIPLEDVRLASDPAVLGRRRKDWQVALTGPSGRRQLWLTLWPWQLQGSSTDLIREALLG